MRVVHDTLRRMNLTCYSGESLHSILLVREQCPGSKDISCLRFTSDRLYGMRDEQPLLLPRSCCLPCSANSGLTSLCRDSLSTFVLPFTRFHLRVSTIMRQSALHICPLHDRCCSQCTVGKMHTPDLSLSRTEGVGSVPSCTPQVLRLDGPCEEGAGKERIITHDVSLDEIAASEP